MAAYVIVLRESPVRDASALETYQRMTREMSGEFAIKPLAVYGSIDSLEGEAPDAAIVLEFPTMEEAKAWYNNPEYQAALPHRLQSADYRAFIVEGF